MNRKVKAINPSSLKLEEGLIVQDLVNRKMFKVKFDDGVYYIEKSFVTFI